MYGAKYPPPGSVQSNCCKDFCYEQTKHISSSVLQAMIHSYVEVRALGKERKEMIEEVYRKIDVEGM